MLPKKSLILIALGIFNIILIIFLLSVFIKSNLEIANKIYNFNPFLSRKIFFPIINFFPYPGSRNKFLPGSYLDNNKQVGSEKIPLKVVIKDKLDNNYLAIIDDQGNKKYLFHAENYSLLILNDEQNKLIPVMWEDLIRNLVANSSWTLLDYELDQDIIYVKKGLVYTEKVK